MSRPGASNPNDNLHSARDEHKLRPGGAEVRASIVMPFLNQERFIAEAIDSVLAQSFDAWELQLVDDGSSDGSTAIARRYAERHPERIRYFEHPGHENRGASASRNLGIRHARGEYIALLDADDAYLPEHLERHLAALERHPEAGMAYTATEYWYSWTGQGEDGGRDFVSPLGRPAGVYQPPQLLTEYLARRITTPCTCSILVRRSSIDRFGGFEDIFRYIYTDQAFYVKQALNLPIVIVDGHWARYRQHPSSSCQVVAATGKGNEVRLNFLNWVERYLHAQCVASRSVWRVVNREKRRCRRHEFYKRYDWLDNTVHTMTELRRRVRRRLRNRR